MFFPPAGLSNNLFGSQVMVAERENKKLEEKIDDTIHELPDLPKLEFSDPILNVLGAEAEDILEDNFVSSKELEDKTLQNIKEEYGFVEIKDAFDHAAVPHQLDFFNYGDNDNFVAVCNFISSNETNNEFTGGWGQNIMTNNSLWIHVESKNIFYNNFDTNENFYSFLLAQQDETK